MHCRTVKRIKGDAHHLLKVKCITFFVFAHHSMYFFDSFWLSHSDSLFIPRNWIACVVNTLVPCLFCYFTSHSSYKNHIKTSRMDAWYRFEFSGNSSLCCFIWSEQLLIRDFGPIPVSTMSSSEISSLQERL